MATSADLITITGAKALRAFAAFNADPVACVEALQRRHGDAVAIKAPFLQPKDAPQGYLFVGPEYNRAILLNQKSLRPTGAWPVPGPKGSPLQNLRRNILCMRGAEHDAYLEAILPTVNRPRVASLFDAAKAIVSEETDGWPQKTAMDITRPARALTQRLAFELLFGAETRAEVDAFGALVDDFHNHSWDKQAFFLRVDAPGTAYRRLLQTAEKLEDFAAAWSAPPTGCPAHQNIRTAVAKTVLPDGRNISDEARAANVAAIGMASYETTALTLSWALFLLTQHPKALRALSEEIDGLGDFNALTAETLEAAALLDGVVKETMRLIAPVPVIGFEAMEDCDAAGTSVTKSARVFISPHLTHRIAAIYERPNAFLPERWSAIRPSAYEYLPFNAGPRRCPGIWFATANLKIALARIIGRYRPALADGARINRGYAATTIAKDGVPMKLLPRDGRFERSPCTGDICAFFEREAA